MGDSDYSGPFKFSRRRLLTFAGFTVAGLGAGGIAARQAAASPATSRWGLRVTCEPSGSATDVAGVDAAPGLSAKDFFRVKLSVEAPTEYAGAISIQVTTPRWFLPVDGQFGSIVEPGLWSVVGVNDEADLQVWEFSANLDAEQEPSPPRTVDSLIVDFRIAQGLVPQVAGSHIQEFDVRLLAGGRGVGASSVRIELKRAHAAAFAVEALRMPTRTVRAGRWSKLQATIVNNAAAPAEISAFYVELGDSMTLDHVLDSAWTIADLSEGRYQVTSTTAGTLRAFERRTLGFRVKLRDSRLNLTLAPSDSNAPIARSVVAYTLGVDGTRTSETSTSAQPTN